MTSTVIHMTHYVDKALVARMFGRFRGRYGNLWTSRATCDEDWEFIIEDWFDELSKFTIDQVRAAVNKTLSIYKEYPPTLGQLVDLCMKESGVPSVQEVIRLMVARDFSHPLVKMVYEKIGSWTLSNGKEDDLQRKAKEHYTEALANFHVEPKKAWAKLEAHNAKPKELAPPPKLPTQEERKNFKDRLTEYQQKLEDEKLNCKGVPYKEFEKSKIKKCSRNFDQAIHDEYREYLLSIPEEKTMILPSTYLYDRNRFINAIEQPLLLKKMGYNPNPQGNAFEGRSGANRPEKVYKSWVVD